MRIKFSSDRQCGLAIVETSLVLIPLLLFASVILEYTYSHKVRQVAQLALFEAAREGSVSAARPQRMEQAFKKAILPLFVPIGSYPSAVARRDAVSQKTLKDTGLRLWQIETLNPGSPAFTDHAHPGLSAEHHRPTLRNTYLAEQHQTNLAKGWTQGRGPVSGLDVFEANTLRLQLSMLYQPRAPGISVILKSLGALRTDRTGQAWRQGYLVLNMLTEVMMQSHARQWETIEPGMSSGRDSPQRSTSITGTETVSRAPAQNLSGSGSIVLPPLATRRLDADERRVTEHQTVEHDLKDDDEHVCGGLICCQ